MRMAPDPLSVKFGKAFWAVWDKVWWLVFLLFVAANVWAGREHGWLTVVRFWGAGFAMIGLLTLLYVWRATARAHESESWPSAEARILHSKVRVEEQRTVDSPSGPDYITLYYPDIEYEYDWEGLTYRSRRILFVKVNYSRSDAEATVARYPIGGRATAYVCPGNPRLAVLERGLLGKTGKYGKAAVIGAVFAVAGVAAWFLIPLIK